VGHSRTLYMGSVPVTSNRHTAFTRSAINHLTPTEDVVRTSVSRETLITEGQTYTMQPGLFHRTRIKGPRP
jgi:hypothetical protein